MASVPTLPPEPALLSTMNCWPVISLSSAQTMRESVSVGPPAGNTLMYLTGLLGQSSAARATPEATIGLARAPADRASARRRETELLIETDPPLLSDGVTFYTLGGCLTATISAQPGRCRRADIWLAGRRNSQSASPLPYTSPCPTAAVWRST